MTPAIAICAFIGYVVGGVLALILAFKTRDR